MNPKLTLLIILFLALSRQGFTQEILFNESGGNPHPSAFLEIESTSKGILIPRITESARLSIAAPAEGLLVFQNNGLKAFYFFNGTNWDTLGGGTSVTNISNVTNSSNSGIAVIRDVKAINVNGGDFTSGGWRQRDLNNIDGDLSFVTLGTNEFKLDSGIYVITINAPAYRVSSHQVRLFNVSDNVQEAVGLTSYSQNPVNSISILTYILSVSGSPKTFQVQHRCSASQTVDGFGISNPWGENVYSQVQIEKL
jgi:hypothetical protein